MQTAVDYKYLNFAQLIEIDSWSTYTLLGKGMLYTQKYPFVKMGDFLSRNKTQVKIQDGVLYKRPTIRMNANGISLRDEVNGKKIGTKNQFRIKERQFLLSKIDARNGAFGVVPKELDNGIITGNFWTFDVDYSKINPHYLTLLTGTKEFQMLSQSASVGTTNRNYLQEDSFLNFKIPLPTLTEQEAIVNAYQSKIQQAQNLEQQAQNIEEEIDKYFLEQLGLKQIEIKSKVKGLLTVPFEELERWDYFSSDIRIRLELKKSKFELRKIGDAFSFAKRSFNKKQYKEDTFDYIEIGAIDPIKGILNSKEVLLSKAPSRATQIVKTDDLIIGTTRPYLKKFAIVTKEFNENVCSSGFTIIEPSLNYYLPYLLHFLKCSYGIEQLKNRMTGGLYPAITEVELKEIKIPFPSPDKQKEIMSLVKQKENTILSNKSQVETLKNEAEQEFEQALFS